MKKKDFEKETIQRFYDRVKTLIESNRHTRQAALDFEVYRLILAQTTKPPKDYLKIFKYLPCDAKKNIMAYLHYKDEREFRVKFRNALNLYNQTVQRTQVVEEDDEQG